MVGCSCQQLLSVSVGWSAWLGGWRERHGQRTRLGLPARLTCNPIPASTLLNDAGGGAGGRARQAHPRRVKRRALLGFLSAGWPGHLLAAAGWRGVAPADDEAGRAAAAAPSTAVRAVALQSGGHRAPCWLVLPAKHAISHHVVMQCNVLVKSSKQAKVVHRLQGAVPASRWSQKVAASAGAPPCASLPRAVPESNHTAAALAGAAFHAAAAQAAAPQRCAARSCRAPAAPLPAAPPPAAPTPPPAAAAALTPC